MRILFAASESVPFVKTGGLGDVVGSLPKYFPKDILDARVILPLYDFIEEKYRKDNTRNTHEATTTSIKMMQKLLRNSLSFSSVSSFLRD